MRCAIKRNAAMRKIKKSECVSTVSCHVIEEN